MSWTKGDLLDQAFAELSLAGYVFDLSPEERQLACVRLDGMMALWASQGIQCGYNLAASPGDTSESQDSGIPLVACQPVYMNLAKLLCGVFGKAVPATTREYAKDGYDTLLLDAAFPPQQQMPSSMPLGAGWKSRSRPFATPPDTAPLQIGESGDLEFLES